MSVVTRAIIRTADSWEGGISLLKKNMVARRPHKAILATGKRGENMLKYSTNHLEKQIKNEKMGYHNFCK